MPADHAIWCPKCTVLWAASDFNGHKCNLAMSLPNEALRAECERRKLIGSADVVAAQLPDRALVNESVRRWGEMDACPNAPALRHQRDEWRKRAEAAEACLPASTEAIRYATKRAEEAEARAADFWRQLSIAKVAAAPMLVPASSPTPIPLDSAQFIYVDTTGATHRPAPTIPAANQERGIGIARTPHWKKPEPDDSVWGLLDEDRLCKDEDEP